jgi:Lrp/AsnC family transcriptional regulator, leucine-responsive regulatory protein
LGSSSHGILRRKEAVKEIDEIDKQILFILQENARSSTKQIAQRIGKISKVAVAYRMRKLVRVGIIDNFTTKLNANKLERGFGIVTRIRCSRKGPYEAELSMKIAKLPGVQSVYRMFGPYDILVIARCKDKESARDLLYAMYGLGGVGSTDTSVVHTAVKESLDISFSDERLVHDLLPNLLDIPEKAMTPGKIRKL